MQVPIKKTSKIKTSIDRLQNARLRCPYLHPKWGKERKKDTELVRGKIVRRTEIGRERERERERKKEWLLREHWAIVIENIFVSIFSYSQNKKILKVLSIDRQFLKLVSSISLSSFWTGASMCCCSVEIFILLDD